MTRKTLSIGWLRLLLGAGAITALAACMGMDTELKTARNNSDPDKADYTARVSDPGQKAKAEAKRARIRAKIAEMQSRHALGKKSTTSLVGYFKDTFHSCPTQTVVFMDDEDDVNNSQLKKDSVGGWVSAVW